MKRKLIMLICLLFLTNIPFVSFAETTELKAADLEAFVDDFMEKKMEEYHIPGAVISVVKDGDVMLSKGYGYADLATKEPMNPRNSIVRSGSVTKSITALAALQLVEDGKLELHTDVNQYLSSFQIPNTFQTPITLHHLLTHTPGFDEYSNGSIALKKEDMEPLSENIAKHIPNRVDKPGVITQYSNHGSALAGYLVETASETQYEVYVEENILKPLNMKNTSFEITPDVVKSYRYYKDDYLELPNMYFNIGPAGELNTTAEDMSHFILANLQNGQYEKNQVFSNDVLSMMHKQQFTNHPELPGVTYGYYESIINGKRMIEKGGSIDGFQSTISLIPEENLGYFISTTSGEGFMLLLDFKQQFMNHFYPAPSKTPMSTDKTYVDALKQYEGTYYMNRRIKTGIGSIASPFMDMYAMNIAVKENGNMTMNEFFKEDLIEYEEVSPLVFQEVNGDQKIVLSTNEAGEQQLFIGEFPEWAYEKISFFEQKSVTIALLILFIFPFQFALIAFLIMWLMRKVRKTKSDKQLSKFRLKLWGLSLLSILFAMATVSLMSLVAYFYYEIAPIIVLSIPFITCLIALVLIRPLREVWKEKQVGLITRIGYSILVIIPIVQLPFLYYWNLLSITL